MPITRLLSLPALAMLAAAAGAQTKSKLTIDQLIQIKHPSGHQWTPDGSHIWFTYDDGGINNVWAAPADGSSPAVALTSYPDGQSSAGGFWSKDGQTFFFPRDGGLLAASVKGGTPHTAWPSAVHGRGFSLSPDGTRVAYTASGPGGYDLIVHTLATNADEKIAHADTTIGAPSWTPDGCEHQLHCRRRCWSRTDSTLCVATRDWRKVDLRRHRRRSRWRRRYRVHDSRERRHAKG